MLLAFAQEEIKFGSTVMTNYKLQDREPNMQISKKIPAFNFNTYWNTPKSYSYKHN